MTSQPSPLTPVDQELRRNRRWLLVLLLAAGSVLYFAALVYGAMAACGGGYESPYGGSGAEAGPRYGAVDGARLGCGDPLGT